MQISKMSGGGCGGLLYEPHRVPGIHIEEATLHPSQYSTVVLTVVRVMIAKYRKSGIWGYRSSLTNEPVELK